MTTETNLLTLTTDIVAAHVSANSISTSDVPALIKSVYEALGKLGQEAPVADAEPAKPVGAVSVRKSLANPDFIISMVDGRPYKALKRHLATNGMTPAEYRQRYGLQDTYPMTAPSYSAKRSEMARALGLGRKAGTKVVRKKVTPKTGTADTAKRRGRPPKQLAASMTAAKKHLEGDAS